MATDTINLIVVVAIVFIFYFIFFIKIVTVLTFLYTGRVKNIFSLIFATKGAVTVFQLIKLSWRKK